VTKYLTLSNLREQLPIWVHSFRGFSPSGQGSCDRAEQLTSWQPGSRKREGGREREMKGEKERGRERERERKRKRKRENVYAWCLLSIFYSIWVSSLPSTYI
jgi:hypothetical protein